MPKRPSQSHGIGSADVNLCKILFNFLATLEAQDGSLYHTWKRGFCSFIFGAATTHLHIKGQIMEISSVTTIATTASQLVDQVTQNNETTESSQTTSPLISGPDTVEISDEGRDLAQSAQTTTASDSSASDATASASDSSSATSSATSSDTSSDTSQTATTTGSTTSTSAGGGASGTSSSSSSNEDAIAKLEQQIQEVQQEIMELTAKALTDDNAKSELEGKQTELASLNAELTQLQSQQQS